MDIKISLTTKEKIKTYKVDLKSSTGGSLIGEDNTTLENDYSVTINYNQGYKFGKINVKVGTNNLIEGEGYILSDDKTKLTIPNVFLIDDITIKLTTDIQWDYNPERFSYTYSWNRLGEYTANIKYTENSEFEHIWITKNIIESNKIPSKDDTLFYSSYLDIDFNKKITQFFSDTSCTFLTIPSNVFQDNPIIAIKLTCRNKK